MRRFWRRDSRLAELEGELRARRARAPSGFVGALAQRAGGETRWLRPKARIGIAAGLAVVALVAVASAGGFSAAQSTTHSAVKVIKKLTTSSSSVSTSSSSLSTSSSSLSTVVSSPANDQYKPGKGCGDPNHLHDRRFECKVSVNSVGKKEGNSGTTPFVFTISLVDTPLSTVTAVWTTADGTATSGVGGDFLPAAGTATFAPGVQPQTASVSVLGDTEKEKNEVFYVNVTSVSSNAYIGNGTGTGTIQNDD
jgi:hypothetical protein